MRLFLTICLLAVSSTAYAHVGVGTAAGFASGFGHPLGGVDHMLAMVAVGILAANVGGRALWAVPLSFMAMMAVGGGLGMFGVSLPFVELGIALSIIVLGLAVAIRRNWPLNAALTLVGAFAVFHGHAHGTEMPLGATAGAYAAGLVIATGLLHFAGIAIGSGISGLARAVDGRRVVQFGGGAISVLGVGVLAGLI